jgi:hypothetical protein
MEGTHCRDNRFGIYYQRVNLYDSFMRPFFVFLFVLHCVLPKAQEVNVNSFQHVVRWVSEANLPRYITDETVQEEVLSHCSGLLRDRFKVEKVNMPSKVDVQYIQYFGKAKLQAPKGSGAAGVTDVSILSFVTRATTSMAVLWHMEVKAVSEGKLIFEKKKSHELEYYSAAGYMTATQWYTPEEYVVIYKQLLNELLGDSVLPEKIVIGSPEQKEKYIREFIAEPERAMLSGKGNFMTGGNFALALSKGEDTITRVRYRDGGESTSGGGFSGVGANILSAMTGLNFGYDSKVKMRRKGKLEYDNGRVISLELSWMEVVSKSTDGSVEGAYKNSPVIGEAYEQNVPIASFAYNNYFHGTSNPNLMEQQMAITHSMKGRIGEDEIFVEMDAETNIIKVMENKKPKAAVIFDNVTAGSSTYSGTKLTENKSTLVPAGKKNAPESYYFYYQPGLTEPELQRYMDAVLLLLFCKGNAM